MSTHQEFRMFEGLIHPGIKLPFSLWSHFSNLMVKSPPTNTGMPAGYTYLAQFLSHEINPSGSGEGTVRIGGSVNLGIPKPTITLASLYGDGDAAYQAEAYPNGKFILHADSADNINSDIFRNQDGAFIGDIRNDENYLLSQMHLFWQKFHNVTYSVIFDGISDQLKRFDATKEFVIFIFKKIVLEDFLKRLLDKDIYTLYCLNKAEYLLKKPLNQMPVEFLHSVFRFGHSMVREEYRIQNGKQQVPLGDLFVLDHTSATRIDPLHVVDWGMLFGEEPEYDKASLIDLKFARIMQEVPKVGVIETKDILAMNIKADMVSMIPTAGEIIDWIRIFEPELAYYAKLEEGLIHPKFEDYWEAYNYSLQSECLPLWLYILMEYSEGAQGLKLGKLGSVIVAEVLMKALQPFENSNREIELVNKHLTTGSDNDGPLSMKHLLTFVSNYSDKVGV